MKRDIFVHFYIVVVLLNISITQNTFSKELAPSLKSRGGKKERKKRIRMILGLVYS